MQATLIKSLDELVVGAYNILTVKEENLRIVKPQDIDFILVPAVGVHNRRKVKRRAPHTRRMMRLFSL